MAKVPYGFAENFSRAYGRVTTYSTFAKNYICCNITDNVSTKSKNIYFGRHMRTLLRVTVFAMVAPTVIYVYRLY